MNICSSFHFFSTFLLIFLPPFQGSLSSFVCCSRSFISCNSLVSFPFRRKRWKVDEKGVWNKTGKIGRMQISALRKENPSSSSSLFSQIGFHSYSGRVNEFATFAFRSTRTRRTYGATLRVRKAFKNLPTKKISCLRWNRVRRKAEPSFIA